MAHIDFRAEAEALRDELVARRRDLHRHPELGFEEFRTAGIVAEELSKLGLEVQTGIGKTGVVGLLEGEREGPTVLVRADMDALPIQELNETEYASVAPGKMHACGHDAHTTIALGVAKVLSSHRDSLAGRVKFVFQPAERLSAARRRWLKMACWNPASKCDFGAAPVERETAWLGGCGRGRDNGGVVTFKINSGQGWARCVPHLALIQLPAPVNSSRRSRPLSAAMSIRWNAVVSVTACVRGCLQHHPAGGRCGDDPNVFTRCADLIERRIHEVSDGLCQAMGCAAAIEIKHTSLPVANHPEVAQRVREVFRRLANEDQFDLNERTMGSEDVGLFMNDIPGMYFFVGSANHERGLNYAHHHPRFDFDEDVLPWSVSLMAAAVADYVMPD
jgi:amidohydrolase